MFPVIVLVFIVLPLAELALLIKVGTWIGVGHTILLIVLWPPGRRFVIESLKGYFAKRLRERSGVIDVHCYESE